MAQARRVTFRDYYGASRLAQWTYLRDYDAKRPRRRGLGYGAVARMADANSRCYDMVLGLPAQLEADWLLLRDRTQRRLLWRSLRDERLLTDERRKALLSILFWTVLIAWAVAGTVLRVVDEASLGAYHAGWTLFFYSIATSLFLPTPFEILLGNAAKSIGVWATVAIAASAKTAGAWLVLLAGDKANDGLSRLGEGGGLLQRLLSTLERFAQRYGYPLIFIVFAIPFMSDTAPLFVAAALRMRKGLFLMVTFAAIVTRSLLFLFAGDVVRTVGALV